MEVAYRVRTSDCKFGVSNKCARIRTRRLLKTQVTNGVRLLEQVLAHSKPPVTNGIPDLRNNSLKPDTSLESVAADLSPSKALRVAKLRSRFAETILRAQTKINVQPTSENDKERLKQQHDQAIARIEAQVKSAEYACEFELKKKRQAEREAARTARQKMERSIDNVDNWRVMKDIEALIGSSVVCRDDNRKTKSVLEQLGLYLKPEYKLEDDDDDAFLESMELEEGEILD